MRQIEGNRKSDSGIREATLADLDFLVAVDLKDEGVGSTHMNDWGPEELTGHREKIAAFISDGDKAAWVSQDTETGRPVGMILWRYRNRLRETFTSWDIIGQLDTGRFPRSTAVGGWPRASSVRRRKSRSAMASG